MPVFALRASAALGIAVFAAVSLVLAGTLVELSRLSDINRN